MIDPRAHHNWFLLPKIMMASGLRPYYAEWWHFTLVDEPYLATYFDIVIDE